MSNFPAPAVSWGDVARVCRRVCILRERGRGDEAESLRLGTLSEMVAAVRVPTDTDASVVERLEAMFALETERVANAAVLAELLAPLLTEQLHPLTVAPDSGPPPTPEVARPNKPATPRAPSSIADFIDEMIAQESPPHRSGGSSQRRAS